MSLCSTKEKDRGSMKIKMATNKAQKHYFTTYRNTSEERKVEIKCKFY